MTTYEEHMIAALHHILKAAGANENLSDGFRRLLKEADSLFSALSPINESLQGEFAEIEKQLKHAEGKIIHWESNARLVWDSGPAETSEYLQAVNCVQTVIESLGSISVNVTGKKQELAYRAQCVQQVAMSRLEEELYRIFARHKQLLEPQFVSCHLMAADIVYDESFVSVEDETVGETSRRKNDRSECMEYTVDLVDPEVIPQIKSIANAMYTSNYNQEFCDTFVSIRRDALDESCSVLKVQKLSIEDILKLEWDILSSMIKRWVCAMKIIVRVYLASEKRLCEDILGDFGSVNSFCFLQISKATILCLLNFGEAIAMGPHKPEKLFRLLDICEVLVDLQPDINGLFSGDVGFFIRLEFDELLKTISISARETFLKFGNAIASNASAQPFPGGGIHHLTRYVMNYIKALTEYHKTLNLLLKDQQEVANNPSAVAETDDGQCSFTTCPMAYQLRSIVTTLEHNLIDKSKLYRDNSLQHIFLMSNIHYMVQKVKSSELLAFFGDEWIRKHKGKCQQLATSYVRATWSSVVSLLRDNGTPPKERCKRFSNAFEDVYKSQTRWLIADLHLREDLQISTSQKVILAYRAFLGQHNDDVADKHIKYTTDDLEKLLLDFFTGSPKSLRNSRRW